LIGQQGHAGGQCGENQREGDQEGSSFHGREGSGG
jgi:hypothetical protein